MRSARHMASRAALMVGAAALALALAGAPAMAASPALLVAWRGVVSHSPEYAAAVAHRDAGLEGRAQARALWLPSLSAQGSAARRSFETSTSGARFAAPGFGTSDGVDFRTSIVGGAARQWAFVLQQPIVDAARVADAEGFTARARAANAQYRIAMQELMLRTAEALAAVTESGLQLHAAQLQRDSAERERDAARQRYEAGDLPVTDWREAQAQCDLLRVHELDVQQAFAVANEAYASFTGLAPPPVGVVPPMAESAAQAAGDGSDRASPGELDAWLRRAQSNSPVLELGRSQLDSSEAERRRWSRSDGIQLSLVGQFGRETLSGHGDYGESGMTQRLATLGVQATLPLFTGGMRAAQRRAAEAGARAARAELLAAQDQVQLQTRSAWLAAGNARARLRALQLASESAALRLDATRIGHESGERTLQELLSAEAADAQSRAAAAAARCDGLVAQLRLAAAAGALDEQALGESAAGDYACGPEPGE
jgi:outer membrane protein